MRAPSFVLGFLFTAAAAACGSSSSDTPEPTAPDASTPDDNDAATGSTVDASAEPPPILHAHNDYEHTRPLLDALDQHFGSVEADVHENGGKVEVSHDLASTKGTLDKLYLDPLKTRVAANGGFVYDDKKPFYLWIDLKEGSPELRSALTTLLGNYDFLATFGAGGDSSKGVVVVLTGDKAGKTLLVTDTPAPRPFIRDSNDYTDSDPKADDAWGYYALPFLSLGLWDGNGSMPASMKSKMKSQIDGAHALGRKVRYYGGPDTVAYWNESRALGVDFLGTDDLAGAAAAMKP